MRCRSRILGCFCVFQGVTVARGQEEVQVFAPVIISDAGIFNTFQNFLPPYIQNKPGDLSSLCLLVHTPPVHVPSPPVFARVEIQSVLGMVRHGMGSFLVFVGLDGTKEELGIVSTNFWMYKDNDLDSL